MSYKILFFHDKNILSMNGIYRKQGKHEIMEFYNINASGEMRKARKEDI